MHNFSESLRELKTLLERQDIRAAVIFLNGLTTHRFTALYRFDHENLQNLCVYDRENPDQEALMPDIPIMASYCVFVRNHASLFAVTESLQDERLLEHPKQQLIQSYCGVPLLDEDGKMFGTICHFDFRPRAISDTNVELMEKVAQLIKSVPLKKQS